MNLLFFHMSQKLNQKMGSHKVCCSPRKLNQDMHNFILLYFWIVLPNHKTNTVKHGRLSANSPRGAIMLFSLSITGIMFFLMVPEIHFG